MKTKLAIILGLQLAAATAMADELTIGTAGPLSGPQAYFGVTWQNGMKIYFDDLNKAGGVAGHTFKLVQLDDKADPREGTLVAQKFCDDSNTLAVLGHFNSGVVLATLPVYSDCGIPDVEFGSNPSITRQGYKNVFRPIANDYAQGGLPASYARNTLKADRAAVVNDKQAFGQGVSEIFAQKFKEAGGTVTSVSSVNPTDVDFTALITQLKGQNPQVVYLGAVMPQLALFAKQMREQNLNARLIVPDGGYTPDLIKQAGHDAAQGVLVSFQVPPYDSTPEIVAFAKEYKARFGEDAGAYSIYGYVLAQIVAEAVKSAKAPTREGVMEALRSLKIQTSVGPIEFDATGELKVAPVFLYEVKGDAFALAAKS